MLKTNKNFLKLKNGTKVQTKDGEGTTVGIDFRKNKNGGPGARQYVVQLNDGRIRHYNTNEIERQFYKEYGIEIRKWVF